MSTVVNEQPVIVITGDSRGIGQHLAAHYSARQFQVVGVGRSELETTSRNHLHLRADIGSEPEVVGLFQQIRERFGRVDVVINNAGVNSALTLAVLVKHSDALATIRTNFLGTFLVCREAAKVMMRRKFGRIINLGSMAVRHEVQGEAIYSASKAAVCSFTRVLAKELHAHGITCNVIAPSAIDTEMVRRIDRKKLDEVLSRNAIPTLGRFEDVSNTVDWLIRPESQAVTGQLIYLGGA